MITMDYEIQVPEDKDSVELAIIGDVHKGSSFFDAKLWTQYYNGSAKHVGFKTDPTMYVITSGDLMETALKDSLGVQEQSEWIESQFVWIRDQLLPIAKEGRLIALVEGNHERRATRNWIRTTRLLGHDLGVPYCPGYLLVNFRLKKNDQTRLYKIAIHHGYGMARTQGGKLNSVMRMAQVVGDADAYIMGHLHDKFAIVKPIFINGKFRERLFGMTGAYLTYGGYAEEKLYSPPARGSLKLKLHFDIKRISGR